MNKTSLFIVGIFITLFLVIPIFAITGSIGNSRMVLRDVAVGDTIEKTILVINRNNETIDVSVEPAGDLKDDIEIVDEEFSLLPGEEKKAAFKIKIREEGESESKINILFTPQEGGNGVGLTSTIIIYAKEGDGSGFFDFGGNDNSDNQTDNTGVSVSSGGNAGDGSSMSNKGLKISGVYFALISTVVMFIVLLVLLIFYSRYSKKNGASSGVKIKTKKSVSR